MAAKPTHVKAVAALLEEGDFESSIDAAKAVLALAEELRAQDVFHVVVCEYTGPVYLGYGPFPTQASAIKAIEGAKTGIPGFGKRAVVSVRHPKHVEATLASLDDLGDLPRNHWTRIAERVR